MNSTLTSGSELVPLGSMMRFPLSHAATISDPGVPTQWQGHIGHDPGSFAHVQGPERYKKGPLVGLYLSCRDLYHGQGGLYPN